ncbi:hypothetical protein [Streptomyces sp. NPDC014006]|uniref:hypothetical protein n=1 Tax=Streptomyces sp. NPDC014006 TaxID=3364870 RepID=UPI0036F800D8
MPSEDLVPAPLRRLAVAVVLCGALLAGTTGCGGDDKAEGDPRLARAIAPLTAGIDALKDLPAKLRKGDTSAAGGFDDVIGKVKEAGRSAGAEVKDKVPSASELAAAS